MVAPTMPRPRYHQLPNERREQILRTAGEEFSAHGYDGASLNRILQRLGWSKGQFYYAFDNKLDLFAAVMDWALDRGIPEELRGLDRLEADTFWPTMDRVSERALELMRAIPWYVGLWRPLYYPPADPRAREIVTEKLERVTAIRRDLIRRGQELGCIRNDLPEDLLLTALFGLRAALDRWFFEHWDALEPQRREVLSRQVFAMFRRMLEPPEDS